MLDVGEEGEAAEEVARRHDRRRACEHLSGEGPLEPGQEVQGAHERSADAHDGHYRPTQGVQCGGRRRRFSPFSSLPSLHPITSPFLLSPT